MKNHYLKTGSYLFLASSLLALFYFHQVYAGPGFMLAIVCTLQSEKNSNTHIFAAVSLISPVVYFLLHQSDKTSPDAAPLFWMIACVAIVTPLILVLKRDIRNFFEQSRQELHESREKVKALNDLKTDFITIASHEFRTPLSTILSSADLLEQYNTPGDVHAKRERHILRIKWAVCGIKSILDDCLSLVKMEDVFFKVNMQAVNPATFQKEVEEMIRDMQMRAKPGQKLHLYMQLEQRPVVDRSLFRDILMHLVSNALKFSPDQGCVFVRIEVAGTLSLVVQDAGIGISREDQQHLFQRFYRASNAGTTQGTGLGLHIVSKYVDLMKGKIDITSQLNEGTTCIVTIPQNHFQPENVPVH